MAETPDTLITTYLHMTRRDQFRPAYVHATTVHIMPVAQPDTTFYLFLYQTVGEQWAWRDRLLMPEEVLAELLMEPARQVHVLYDRGAPAGYIELHRQGSDVQVDYFGLRPAFTGRGLGKHLLSYGVDLAWNQGAERVWLHTCNLDSPYALPNYRARGFEVYDVVETPMPDVYQ
jgi:GNAT superfamily N-acetyltransferase